MKKFGMVHFKFIYLLIGKALDLWADMKGEFKEHNDKQNTKEAVYVEVETVENGE